MVLPTFLVIGAMKCGTSALHDWLGQHPDVFVPGSKELNYFAVPHVYPRGLADYEQLFEPGADSAARGEASPSYAMSPMYPGVPDRIASVIPAVRLIYLVRDPVKRVMSNYLHALASGAETRQVDHAVLEDDRYAQVSCYATQLEAYLEWFEAEQVLVLPMEELASSGERLCRHLGIDSSLLPSEGLARVHETADKRRMRSWATRWEKRFPGLGGSSAWQQATRTDLDPGAAVLAPATVQQLNERFVPEMEALRPWLPAGHDGWGLLAG
jgi:hypothetical protein